MINSLFKLGAGLLTAYSTKVYSQSEEEAMLMTMKRVLFLPSFRESMSLSYTSPSLVYMYSDSSMSSDSTLKLSKSLGRLNTPDLSLYKMYMDEQAIAKVKDLGLSQEEIEVRAEYDASIFYFKDGKHYKLPIGIPKSEVHEWVAKCNTPILPVSSISDYFHLARGAMKDEDSFIVLANELTQTQEESLAQFSRMRPKVPVLRVSSEISDFLQLSPGITLVKQHSVYDGDAEPRKLGTLKYIPYGNKQFNVEEIDDWVKETSWNKVYYCSDFNKIFPLFTKIHTGSLRCLYVLTSQMNPYSKKYKELMKELYQVASDKPIVVAVVPNDEIARKLGIIRTPLLRRIRTPELRYVDYNYMVSIETNEEGEFPVTNCRESECSNMIRNHYVRKFSINTTKVTSSQIHEFVAKALDGELIQYYEREEDPLYKVSKLCSRNFKEKVIDCDKDVIVELYGKYCPACIEFRKSYEQIAEGFQGHKDKLVIAKICIDHNYVPEISDKKPYTPIFWFYKKGNKEAPIQYTGKLNPTELREFIKSNISFDLSNS